VFIIYSLVPLPHPILAAILHVANLTAGAAFLAVLMLFVITVFALLLDVGFDLFCSQYGIPSDNDGTELALLDPAVYRHS